MAGLQQDLWSDVRFGSLADITATLCNVRFTPNSGHHYFLLLLPHQSFCRARGGLRIAAIAADATNKVELADLDVGDGETSEVIESELDATGEAAVASAIAKAEVCEAQDLPDKAAKKEQVLKQLRAYRDKNSGVKVAPDDPLATDKIRVTRYLKSFDRTPADLPAGFWDEPDRDVRGIMLGEVVGPVMAERLPRAQIVVSRVATLSVPQSGWRSGWSGRATESPLNRYRRLSSFLCVLSCHSPILWSSPQSVRVFWVSPRAWLLA